MGIGLRRSWVRSEAACVAAYSEEILGNWRVAGGKSVVLETRYLAILGI